MDKKALIESIKEPLRYILLALVAYLLSEGVINVFVGWMWGTKLDQAVMLIIVGALTSVLRGIDKYLHEVAVAEPAKTRNEGLGGVKGLTYI